MLVAIVLLGFCAYLRNISVMLDTIGFLSYYTYISKCISAASLPTGDGRPTGTGCWRSPITLIAEGGKLGRLNYPGKSGSGQAIMQIKGGETR